MIGVRTARGSSRRRASVRSGWITMLMLALIAVQTHAAPRYRVTDLGVVAGGSWSFAYAINDAGQVTGESGLKPFLWQAGAMLTLPAPSGVGSNGIGRGINRHGDVVGSLSGQAGLDSTAVIWKSGTPSLLSNLPGSEGHGPVAPAGVNAAGVIVGTELVFRNSITTNRAIAIKDGEITELPRLPDATAGVAWAVADTGYIAGQDSGRALLWRDATSLPSRLDSGGLGAGALAVNEFGAAAGAVLGSFEGSDQFRGAVWNTAGSFSVIDALPGRTKSFAFGMNDALQVVGAGDSAPFTTLPGLPNPSASQRAFLWDNGGVHDLNALIASASGWHLAQARDINNNGEIVGVGFNPEGNLRGFMLTPVPEPHQYALMLAGLVLVGKVAKLRAKR